MIFLKFWYIFENPKILRMWKIMKFRKTIFWMFFYVPIDLYRLVSVSMSPSGHFDIFIVNITVLFALFGWIEVVLQISENLEIRMRFLWFVGFSKNSGGDGSESIKKRFLQFCGRFYRVFEKFKKCTKKSIFTNILMIFSEFWEVFWQP